MKPDCIFCAIVSGIAPASVLYEDNWTLAFLDINPINPGHTLVIPKRHHQDLFSIDKPLYQKLADTTRLMAQAVQTALQPAGLNIFQANGVAAGQTVFHFHNHVLPRYPDDRLHVQLHPQQPGDLAKQQQKFEPPEAIADAIRQQAK